MSIAQTGRYISDEHKRKIGLANSQKRRTLEERKRISETQMGRKASQETKNKMSISHSGEKNHFWKGGISTYKRKVYLNSRRRALKRNATGTHTEDDWENLKKEYNYICPSCFEKEPNITLTEDHITPLIKGGNDNIENIQPLCRSCNCKKNTKIIKYDYVKTNQRLPIGQTY